MKIIDLSHVMNVHTPGWVGYAGNKMYYAQNLQTVRIVAQRIDTALHVGTHFDGAMHATDNPKGDMAHLPLDYLVNRGVVVDISKRMHDWAVITPEIIESAGADIREGDILILHTGWHKHYEGPTAAGSGALLLLSTRGPSLETLQWMFKKKIKWWGMDTGCVRPRHEHVDPLHAARSRRGVHEKARQDASVSSSARSSTRTRNPAARFPPMCFRFTTGPSRKAFCTRRISAATSS